MVGDGGFGVEPQPRLAECGLGLGELPLGFQGTAEAVVQHGVVGLELERGTVFGFGIGTPSLVFEGVAEVAMVGYGLVRLELQRRAEFGLGLGQLPE